MTLPMARSRRKGVPSQAPTASQARRKWNKMRGEGYIGEDDDEESAPFDTLHLLDTKALPDFAKSIIVRRKPPEPVPQLSRPPRVAIPPIPEKAPPVSSGFGAFQEKYRELEKAGLIDGTGEWPDDDNNGSPLPTQPSTQPSA
ncbi:hypothetical protein EVJ58_g10328 [Rhodofomes roseus]|nr:hypothetical protein EVJ58_g10328 [Rhodofomes roseus]